MQDVNETINIAKAKFGKGSRACRRSLQQLKVKIRPSHRLIAFLTLAILVGAVLSHVIHSLPGTRYDLAKLSESVQGLIVGIDPQADKDNSPMTELEFKGLVLEVMKGVGNSLSVVRGEMLARTLARVAFEELDTYTLRIFWVAIIAKESKFAGSATSRVGAVGIGQLMPKYMKDFGKKCGYVDVQESDLRDDHVNARLSACYFRALVREYENAKDAKVKKMAIPLALAAYNAGAASQSVENFKHFTSMAHEPANYVAGVFLITRIIGMDEGQTVMGAPR